MKLYWEDEKVEEVREYSGMDKRNIIRALNFRVRSVNNA